MELGQGFPVWTELGQDSGLDPLGMQRPIESIYQSLIPGISTITLRYRYYSFFSFILKHYEEKIRHPDPVKFRSFQRKCEALLALVCCYRDPDLGITGTNWATRELNRIRAKSDKSSIINFTVGADPDAEESQRYLRNKGGALGAIYATQMSEMGLIHFPDAGSQNPNPICSDVALKLADSVSRELGKIADDFFVAVETGEVALSSLESFETMKPSKLNRGSEEHNLLKEILFERGNILLDTALMRRNSLKMLLKTIDDFGSIPTVEDVKWFWFQNVFDSNAPKENDIEQLWFLFQACDLIRLAYEVILSAALTVLASDTRRRISLDELTDELVEYVEIKENQSWEGFSQEHTVGMKAFNVRECYIEMLDAMKEHDTSIQVQKAVLLIAILSNRGLEYKSLIEKALDGADYFQSLRTETQFLFSRRTSKARDLIGNLVRERIIKRHLFVASRKFRNQQAYTFHMEPEEGLLRYRSSFKASPSSPRLDQALRFLRDIYLINDEGVTPYGYEEMAAK